METPNQTETDSNILLIEDNVDHQLLISRKIKKLGIEKLTVCKDGEEGLEQIKEGEEYDIIIIDFSLPGKTGIEIAKEIRIFLPNVSLLMITGQGSEKIAVEAMKAGIDDYITKKEVLQSEALIIALKSIIHRRMTSTTLSISKQLAEDPEKLSISIFRFGQYGPEPIFKSKLPFEMNKDREDAFYLKIGLYYMTSIGAGHTFAEGLYQLPVPDYEQFHGLVFGFRMKDEDHTDSRFQVTGKNYGLLVVIYPKLFRPIVPDHFSLEIKVSELMVRYADMKDLASTNFIVKLRDLFTKKQIEI